MTGWGVELDVPCEDCGATARRSVGQHVRDGRLGWDAEFWCPACGTAMCLGFGTRDAPRWVRDPLIDRHGTVRLRLAAPAADRVAALRTVRAVRDLPLPRSLELVRQLTDDGLPGTPAEAEWLRGLLSENGVTTEPAPGGAPADAD